MTDQNETQYTPPDDNVVAVEDLNEGSPTGPEERQALLADDDGPGVDVGDGGGGDITADTEAGGAEAGSATPDNDDDQTEGS